MMVWQWIAGNWKQLIGPMRDKWGKLALNDLIVAAGEREQLVGLLEEHYAYPKAQAEMEIDEFARTQKALTETELQECSPSLKL